jgi:hypothetical protein
VENVVDAVVATGALDGGDGGGLFNNADEAVVARGAGTVGAGVNVGDVVADGAESQGLAQVEESFGERDGVFFVGAEEMEGVTLRALGSHAGEFFELFDESGLRFSVTGH